MKRPARYYLTYLWTWPWDIISWVVILTAWALWGHKLHWLEGLWFEFKEGSWPDRKFKMGGNCLGHGGMFFPTAAGGEGIDTPVEFHEHFHSEQYEAAMLLGFLYGLTMFLLSWSAGSPVPGALCGGISWVAAGALSYASASFQAWMRGEEAYHGNHLEEAAYAVTGEWAGKQESQR